MDAKQILINFPGRGGAGAVYFGDDVYFRNLMLAWLLEGRGGQEVWSASAERCLVPFFHIGAPT